MDHIAGYGSSHTEAIVTADYRSRPALSARGGRLRGSGERLDPF